MMKVKVLGVDFDYLTMMEAVGRIATYLASGRPHQVVTANSEMVMLAQEDAEFKKILAEADLVTGDGAGIVWASGRYGNKMPGRVTGIDLIYSLLPVLAKKKYRIYFLGAAPGVAEEAKAKLLTLYPELNFVGIRDGYFAKEEEHAVLAEIKEAKPDLLLVALGFPRQEKWIKEHLPFLQTPVAIGVGGSFDVISGKIERAPRWMQKCSLEWLYRLYLEPKRIGRMMVLPRFVLAVLKDQKKG